MDEIEIINAIENFLLSIEPEKITSSTLVFQAIKHDFHQPYNILEKVIRSGVDAALMKIRNDNVRTSKIYEASQSVCI